MSLSSIIKTIGAEIEKVWNAVTGELKKVLPEAISVVSFFANFVANPIAGGILTAVTGGKISEEFISHLNTILPKLLKGLYSAQDVENLSIHDTLEYYAKVFADLTDEQRAAFYTQLATEIVKVTGGDEAKLNSELTAIGQYLYSLQQNGNTIGTGTK